MEYSIESAAFFNPSIIEHPDQSETGPGEKRVIISFRATGEGHISSIVFRTGVLDKNNNLSIEPVGNMLEEAQHIRKHIYDKVSFKNKLDDMKDFHALIPSGIILDKLNNTFTHGETIYYATYTAYDGTTILPKMLETRDFYHFKILPLHGEIAQNKGMALFPRKVNGKYAMLCRLDGSNNYISYSDNINIWREAKLLQQPKFPLLVPNAEEREGYVPNVVYSCGSMIHNDKLIIPSCHV